MKTTSAMARLLTAPGPGAVAVIQVQLEPGLHANAFQPFTRPDQLSPFDAVTGRILYGRWNGEDLVIVRTGSQTWEIQCHGGQVAVDRILADLQHAGINRQPVGGYSSAAVSAGSSAAGREAAVITTALQLCRTRQAADIVLRQADGRQRPWMQQVQQDDPVALQHLNRWLPLTRALLHGFRILLTGEPNAGKSSLLNLLCGRQRAIVSETPGTTRDLLEAETCLAGWVLQFHDSAGIRSATDSEIEADGIRRSLSAANTVDLICCVAGLQPVPMVLLQAFAAARCPVLLVQNKADLLTGDERAKMSSQAIVAPFAARVVVSALTGEGLPELHQRMLHLLIPEQPAADAPLPLEQALSQFAVG